MATYTLTTVIEGGAPGADTLAREWALANNILVEEYKAEWGKYGKAAGPIRNKRMLDEGKPDVVVGFTNKDLSESRGTANMIKQAVEADIVTYLYHYPNPISLIKRREVIGL